MTYLMSDIHGLYGAFLEMLALIKFSDGDRLYVLGDAVDRGPDGIRLLRHISKSGNMRLVMGNHEDMMLRALDPENRERDRYMAAWMDNGGEPTLAAYGRLSWFRKKRLLADLERAPRVLDIPGYRLAHASWHPGDPRACMWDAPSPYIPGPPSDGLKLVFGHTPSFLFRRDPAAYLGKCGRHMELFHGDWFTGIDCGAGLPGRYSKRALACLRAEDGEESYIDL